MSVLLVKIYPDAFVRFKNFNPPAFCLVCAIISGAWKHDFTTRLACYVYNSIWASCRETIKMNNCRRIDVLCSSATFRLSLFNMMPLLYLYCTFTVIPIQLRRSVSFTGTIALQMPLKPPDILKARAFVTNILLCRQE